MPDIRELLEEFRKSSLYHHVIYVQNFSPKKIRRIILERIIEFDEDDFREIMQNYFMLGRMGEAAVEYILRNNDFNDIKFRLLNLFIGTRPLIERFESLLEIKGINLFYGSHFLRAVGEDDYVIYYSDVLEGIRDLLPEIAPERVETVEDYFDFNELCKEIRDAYGFRDLGELHEFFWHGHKNRWEGWEIE